MAAKRVRKWLKRLVVVVGGIVLILLIAALVVLLTVDVNKFHGPLARRLSGALGRNVELGRMRLTLMPVVTLTVDGVKVSEDPDFGEGDFLTIDRFEIEPAIMPLLDGRLEAKAVHIIGANLKIVINESGMRNLSSIGETRPKGEDGSRETDPPVAGRAAYYDIGIVRVVDGNVSIVDLSREPPLRVKAQNIRASLAHLTPITETELNASWMMLGGTVTARGTFGPTGTPLSLDTTPADLTIKTERLNLGPVLSKVSPIETVLLSADGTLVCEPGKAVSAEGNLQGDAVAFLLPQSQRPSVIQTCSIEGGLSFPYDSETISATVSATLQGVEIGWAEAPQYATFDTALLEGIASYDRADRNASWDGTIGATALTGILQPAEEQAYNFKVGRADFDGTFERRPSSTEVKVRTFSAETADVNRNGTERLWYSDTVRAVGSVARQGQQLSADLSAAVTGATVFGTAEPSLQMPSATGQFKAACDFSTETVSVSSPSAKLLNSEMEFDATVNGFGANRSLNARFASEKLYWPDVLTALPSVAKAVRDKANLQGIGDVKIRAEAKGDEFRGEVEADLSESTLRYGDLISKQRNVPCSLSADVRGTSKKLRLTRYKLLLDKNSAQGSADILFGDRPRIDGSLKLASLDLGSLSAVAPLCASYGLSGELSGNVKLTGPLDALLSGATANVTLSNVGAKMEAIPEKIEQMNGAVSVSTIPGKEYAKSEALSFAFGESKMNVSGQLTDLAAPKIDVTASCSSLDVNRLIGALTAPSKRDVPSETHERSSKQTVPPLLQKASGRARLSVGSLKFSGAQATDFATEAQFSQGNLSLNGLRFEFAGGAFTGSGAASFAGTVPSYSVKGRGEKIDVAQVLSFTKGMKGAMTGTATTRFDLSSGGRSGEEVMTNLTGSGGILIPRGRMTKFNLARELDLITGLLGLGDGARSITDFENLQADFSVERRKVTLPALAAHLQHFDLTGTGESGFDRRMNFQFSAVLSEELSQKNRGKDLQKAFEDDTGRIVVPFYMRGAFPDVRINVDLAAVASRAAQRGMEEFGRKAIERLRESLGRDESETEEPEKEPARQRPAGSRLEEVGRQLLRDALQ